MRRFPLVTAMILLVAAVLGLSIWTINKAARAALREYRVSQTRVAQDTASALRGYLESFDRDTRLLATLVQGTRRQAIDSRAQNEAVLSAFQALATVVAHYRTIALFGPGALPIVAVDPTEDRGRIAPQLVEASAPLARRAVTDRRTAMSGPLTLPGGRAFYLFAAPAGDGEAVVVTADAAMMLEVVSRAPSSADGLVIFDPSGALWLDCERRERCRLLRPGTPESAELIEAVDTAATRGDATSRPAVGRLGLPTHMMVVAAPPVYSPLGKWSVALVGSAGDIDVQQRSFLRHLLVTSTGVIGAMVLVGLFILRQQAAAAALRVRVQDAEEMASLQRQLVRAEKLVTVGVLSAGIAHEIGTPLQVIRGRAEHLLEKAQDRHAAEALRAIVSEIDRISSTIRQVLQFSRQQPMELASADARDSVNKALELLDWRLSGKRLSVHIEAEDSLPLVAAATGQLDQVVLNLLMNACDASSEGKSIEISLARDLTRGDCLRLAVTDHGVGIPPENLNAVFDPYFTTKERGEGTGLGLAITSQIVRSHSGEIALKSVVGVGTVATVFWPILAAGSVHA